MPTIAILGLLTGIIVVSVLGILSARAARSTGKTKPEAVGEPGRVIIVIKKDEPDRNKSNPDAMEMAAGGKKNASA
jgi:hypothetical protein